MSNNAKSLKKPSEVDHAAFVKAGDSQAAFEEMYCALETDVGDSAVTIARGSHWKQPYATAFILTLAVLVLQILSVSVDMFYIEMQPPVPLSSFSHLVCQTGCSSADQFASLSPFRSASEFLPHTSAMREIVAQMQPFAATCLQLNDNDYNITVSSTTSKASAQYRMKCIGEQGWQMPYGAKVINFKYAVGFNFIHAIGASHIYHMDYSIKNQAPILVVLMFVFSGLSIVLYAAVIRLRQRISSFTEVCAHRQGSAENVLLFCFRRLSAALIFFLTCSVVMALVQLVVRHTKTVPSDRCYNGCRDNIEISEKYWIIIVLTFVLNLIALFFVCVCYANHL